MMNDVRFLLHHYKTHCKVLKPKASIDEKDQIDLDQERGVEEENDQIQDHIEGPEAVNIVIIEDEMSKSSDYFLCFNGFV